jgi:hypothetical protein
MTPFDWVSFFDQNGIDYQTSGPNTSRAHVTLHCPWCGVADKGYHLSVSLAGKGFRCFRQPLHVGKNPARLIQALLNCSMERASTLAGNAKTLPNDFMNKIKTSLVKQDTVQIENKLKLPVEFKSFSKLPSCKIYLNYINLRGFTIKDAEDYKVYYAFLGPYKGRIIFTVEYEEKLVGWTGRTVYSSQNVRYKTLTNDPETAKENNEIPAPRPISDFLLFYDKLLKSDAETIVLCEGPFDAWKVNVLGKYLGVVATCFFTSTMSKQQLNLLHGLLPKFRNKFLLLDQNTFSKAARIKADLIALGIVPKRMSDGIKDPGDIKSVKELEQCLQLAN